MIKWNQTISLDSLHQTSHHLSGDSAVMCYITCVAGLRELTLSANPGISSKGWARLAIAVAHSSQLRVLNLDYNPLGTCFWPLLFAYTVLVIQA